MAAPIPFSPVTDPPNISALTLMVAGLFGNLFARHPNQQADQLRWLIHIKFAERRAGKEARQHRLADIHRVENTSQCGVAQSEPPAHFQTYLWLISPNELLRGLLVTLADPASEFGVIGPRRGRFDSIPPSVLLHYRRALASKDSSRNAPRVSVVVGHRDQADGMISLWSPTKRWHRRREEPGLPEAPGKQEFTYE